jgi:glycosyltransferase involved in cell wall biosynthesis
VIKLSIVIPVYNAEKTIGHLCSTLIDLYSAKYRLDIVLVNDGSRDSSDLVCRSVHAANPDVVTYVKLAKNFGEHNAVIAGLNQASGDYCVIMDDDFQNPPAEVVKLVDEIENGYDVVYSFYASKRDSWFRNLGSKINDMMATVILKKPGDLYLSSFKVVNRFLMKEIIKYTGPDPYLDAIILRTTDNIGKIRLEHKARTYSESGYTIGKLVSLWGNMLVSFSLVPLRVVGIMGIVIAITGIVYGIYKMFDELGVAGGLTDFETLMSVNLFFRGATLLAVSLLGEYVGRIYLSLNKDPQFVIRDRLPPSAAKGDHIKYLKEYKAQDGQ